MQRLKAVLQPLARKSKKVIDKCFGVYYNIPRCTKQIEYADMAELVDALDSGSSGGFPMEVRVLLSA